MTDRLTAIEVFVGAVRRGSLSAVARHMGMSPTMAARHLDDLEARLGTSLLTRSTRRLSLTGAGEAYLDRAERLLGDLSEADAEAAADTASVEGNLRLSAPAVFGALHLPGLLAEFKRLHPGIRVELGLDDRVVDLLEERWDMAIRIGQLSDSSLRARRLAPVRTVVCAAPAYLAARGTPRRIVDLADHDCLGYTLSPRFRVDEWAFGRDGQHRVRVSGSLTANNGQVLAGAAIAGHGLLYGPRFIVADALADGRLVILRLDEDEVDIGAIHAVTHPTRRPAARVRAFVEFLIVRLQAEASGW